LPTPILTGKGDLMGEKRKVIRRHLYDYLNTYDKLTSELVGELVDISPQGIKLVCEKAVTTGSILSLKIPLPKEAKEGDEMDFDAKCIWCHNTKGASGFEIGFQLLNISAKDLEIMKKTFWGNW
jgi:hypothetical protein